MKNGRIVAIEIVEQIPYTSLPELTVLSSTGFGAIIRPIMSLKREDRRTDPNQAGVFKVVQCVGTFASEERSKFIASDTSVVRGSDNVTSTTTTSETIEQVQPQTTQTTETNVSNTTTSTQTTTNNNTQTGTTTTPSQQTSGQSNTPANNNNSGGSGSSGSGGGQSSGGGYGY